MHSVSLVKIISKFVIVSTGSSPPLGWKFITNLLVCQPRFVFLWFGCFCFSTNAIRYFVNNLTLPLSIRTQLQLFCVCVCLFSIWFNLVNRRCLIEVSNKIDFEIMTLVFTAIKQKHYEISHCLCVACSFLLHAQPLISSLSRSLSRLSHRNVLHFQAIHFYRAQRSR